MVGRDNGALQGSSRCAGVVEVALAKGAIRVVLLSTVPVPKDFVEESP